MNSKEYKSKIRKTFDNLNKLRKSLNEQKKDAVEREDFLYALKFKSESTFLSMFLNGLKVDFKDAVGDREMD